MFGLRLGVCLSWSGFNDDAAVPDVDSASSAASAGYCSHSLASPFRTPFLLTARLTLSTLSLTVATVWKLSKLN